METITEHLDDWLRVVYDDNNENDDDENDDNDDDDDDENDDNDYYDVVDEDGADQDIAYIPFRLELIRHRGGVSRTHTSSPLISVTIASIFSIEEISCLVSYLSIASPVVQNCSVQ